MDDICDVALFITHVTLEVQFPMQSFWPITLDLLSSWQVKPSCYCHQLKLSGDMPLVCLKDCQYPGILKNLTNRTLCRSWYVGMMTVQFFSCQSVVQVRGMQKNSFCHFLNNVHHVYHPLCVILPAIEMIKFPMRFTIWDICARNSVAFTVCDIFHKIQSFMLCSALRSVFLIESISVSKCSLCFDV